jgi:mycothiol synthase
VACRSPVADVEIRTGSADDVEAAYAVLAACGGGAWFELGLEELRALWRSYPATWVAEDDMIVAYAAVRGSDAEVYVLPHVRRQGIGSRLLREAERAIEGPRAEVAAPSDEPTAAPFLHRHGYETSYEFWLMQTDLEGFPEPTWPDGIITRTFRRGEARAVKALLDLSYSEEPDFRPPSFEDWSGFMLADPSFDPSCWFIAEAPDGSLAGAALNWKEGYVKDLVVHPAHRRRGLGEALMLHTFGEFARRGVGRISLKTDSRNPTEAWRLYERLGMRVARTYEAFAKRL